MDEGIICIIMLFANWGVSAHEHVYILTYTYTYTHIFSIVQSAGAVEYTDCTSAEW